MSEEKKVCVWNIEAIDCKGEVSKRVIYIGNAERGSIQVDINICENHFKANELIVKLSEHFDIEDIFSLNMEEMEEKLTEILPNKVSKTKKKVKQKQKKRG